MGELSAGEPVQALAAAAAGCAAVRGAAALTRWVGLAGRGRKLSAAGALRRPDVPELGRVLGVDVPGKVRSVADLPQVQGPWAAALALGLLRQPWSDGAPWFLLLESFGAVELGEPVDDRFGGREFRSATLTVLGRWAAVQLRAELPRKVTADLSAAEVLDLMLVAVCRRSCRPMRSRPASAVRLRNWSRTHSEVPGVPGLPDLPAKRVRRYRRPRPSTRSNLPGTAIQAATLRQPNARSRLKAALISERWVNAWGKLPSCSPVGPISSANRPRWLA